MATTRNGTVLDSTHHPTDSLDAGLCVLPDRPDGTNLRALMGWCLKSRARRLREVRELRTESWESLLPTPEDKGSSEDPQSWVPCQPCMFVLVLGSGVYMEG